MILLNSLKGLGIGNIIAWRFIDKIDNMEPIWVCIARVNGLHKKTTYPRRNNGMVYDSKELINLEVLAKTKEDDDSMAAFLAIFLLQIRKNEMECGYAYDLKSWEVWLIENEKDYIEVLKPILVSCL